jgi:hypothetical protein
MSLQHYCIAPKNDPMVLRLPSKMILQTYCNILRRIVDYDHRAGGNLTADHPSGAKRTTGAGRAGAGISARIARTAANAMANAPPRENSPVERRGAKKDRENPHLHVVRPGRSRKGAAKRGKRGEKK